MGFFSNLFGQDANKQSHTQNTHKRNDPEYIHAIAEIPTGWKQYEESLRLIKSTIHCDTYFDRKEFAIVRLETVKRLIDYIGEKNSFIDLMTNTEVTVTSNDVDQLIGDLKFNDYDSQFIKRYSESLLKKINSLKTAKAKLNNIDKWQQWLDPYNNQLSQELRVKFHDYCVELQGEVNKNN